MFSRRVAQQLVPSLPRIVLRKNLFAKNDEQQVPMKNLEAGFLFRCINLIVGLEVRGQPSPQLYSDEGMQSNWLINELVCLTYFKCDSLQLFGLIGLNRFSVLALRNRKWNCLNLFFLEELPRVEKQEKERPNPVLSRATPST